MHGNSGPAGMVPTDLVVDPLAMPMMPSCTGLAGRTPSPGVSAVATGVGDDRFATSLMHRPP